MYTFHETLGCHFDIRTGPTTSPSTPLPRRHPWSPSPEASLNPVFWASPVFCHFEMFFSLSDTRSPQNPEIFQGSLCLLYHLKIHP